MEAASDKHPKAFFDIESRKSFLEQAEGSGILVKPGYVLTNYHVVHNAQRLRVTFANGLTVMAQPDDVVSDKLTDLAVIRIPVDTKPDAGRFEIVTEFADSDKEVHVGDWALAVGSPFGLKQTVTAGIISAKGRVELRLLDFVELLQTDAAISRQLRRAARDDQLGRVIGINVAIASRTGINQGVGFAIQQYGTRNLRQAGRTRRVVRGFSAS